jgi:hypothetical protein
VNLADRILGISKDLSLIFAPGKLPHKPIWQRFWQQLTKLAASLASGVLARG